MKSKTAQTKPSPLDVLKRKPPVWINDEAKSIWRRIEKYVPNDCFHQRTMLLQYCLNMSRMHTLTIWFRNHEVFYKASNGRTVFAPQWDEYRQRSRMAILCWRQIKFKSPKSEPPRASNPTQRPTSQSGCQDRRLLEFRPSQQARIKPDKVDQT